MPAPWGICNCSPSFFLHQSPITMHSIYSLYHVIFKLPHTSTHTLCMWFMHWYYFVDTVISDRSRWLSRNWTPQLPCYKRMMIFWKLSQIFWSFDTSILQILLVIVLSTTNTYFFMNTWLKELFMTYYIHGMRWVINSHVKNVLGAARDLE